MHLNKPKFLVLAFLPVFLLISCDGLKYTPVKTPAELAVDRIDMLEDQLQKDFAAQQMKYQSIAFGETELVKPPSHYLLDSLYELKFDLENKNQRDEELESKIRAQQLLVSIDTTKSYYIENHVFGLENLNDSIKKYDVYQAEIYIDQNNKILETEILSSASIPKKYAGLYACYVLKTSFLFPNTFPEPVETEFYKLYDSKLETLNEADKNAFLQFMLSVMKLAAKNNTLDKQFLIKEFVRLYVQGSSVNMLNEKFVKMEEFFDAENQLLYYQVDYRYQKKTEGDVFAEAACDVFLDPYLQLIEIRKK